MDNELATEPQIKFMKSLKIEVPTGITKMEARLAIDRVLNKSDVEPKPEVVRPGIQKGIVDKPNNYTTMYVSYAKDVFCNIMDNNKELVLDRDLPLLMTNAINLIKQAKEAFE